MKRIITVLVLIMLTLSLCVIPVSAADNDPMAAFEEFISKYGKTGVYSAPLNGGGSFSMMLGGSGDKIICSIVQYENVEDYREGFDFSITINDKFDGEYSWVCNTEDGNGTTKSRGTISKSDDRTSGIMCTEYIGDEYIKSNIIRNVATFRNDLVRAIANDLNYYFDESLEFFGFNPQFLCPDGHTFGEWIYQKNAKLNVNGTEKRTCSVCFATEEREKEGSMLTPQPAPETIVTTPETQEKPEVQPDTQQPTPQEPVVLPDDDKEYQFEQELNDDGDEDEDKKKELPPYVIPVVIGIVVLAAAGIGAFLLLSKRTKKEEYEEEESDVFSDDDF